MLEVKTKAPDFTLKDKDGKEVSLSDFKGKKVVVYFYPKDDTPGCTKQACNFRDNFNTFVSNDIAVIGISRDDETSHADFINKYDLPFILLSDPSEKVLKAYDVLDENSPALGVVRTTYVIDENGIIEKANSNVKAEIDGEDVLNYLGVL